MKLLRTDINGVTAFLLLAQWTQALTFVEIGDPFNPSDSSGKGSVSYPYAISQTEVPSSDYVEFLNSIAKSDPFGLWSTDVEPSITRIGTDGTYVYSVSSISSNKPVIASTPKILRFINWLHNNKPTGAQSNSTTEDGAYSFFGINTFTLRNSGAKYWLPNENEWRKAAYYDPNTRTHRLYPHGDTTPTVAVGSQTGDVANPSLKTYVCNSTLWGNNTSSQTMSVGTSGSYSPWGTLDQGGNAWEIFEPTQPGFLDSRLQGGGHNSDMTSMRRTGTGANNTGSVTRAGFHVGRISAGTEELDTDNDGTPNSLDSDDDGDGVSDADEAKIGTNPFVSDLAMFLKIKDNPAAFGLFRESDILNFKTRGFTCKISSGQILLKAPVSQSDNLIDWNSIGTLELSVPVDQSKSFYRFTIVP